VSPLAVVPPRVTIRKFPAPYRAMLAVCSDLDETPDARVYLEIARFLNTRDATAIGEGVGLEVGNSMYFDMPSDQFSYWGTDERGREMIRALVGSGHIDAIHSWGDLASGRRHAERNIAELERHGCRLEVWIDHSKSPSNFGPDIMVGTGDLPGAAAYHADLTLAYGVRYVWRGRTTGLTSQDAPVGPRSFAPMLRKDKPLVSTRTVVKEAAKVALGLLGSRRWRLYGLNRVCRPCALRDGRRAWEFLRTNPSWGGPGGSATAAGIADVLTPRMLDTLVAGAGTAILYTHLGKIADPVSLFPPGTVAAFRHLARRREAGTVLVTTTRRLLRYVTVRDHLRWRAEVVGHGTVVTVEAVDDPVLGSRPVSADDLHGLTFGVEGSGPVEVRLPDGKPLASERVETKDGTTWVRLPWPSLSFPEVRVS
jgi:hypothetical protein